MLISVPVTALFWLFFSDMDSLEYTTETQIATVLNEEYKKGDIVFPTPDWDIGFTKYLRDGITDISYTLRAYSAEELAGLFEDSSSSFFFIVPDESEWESISKEYRVKEKNRFKVDGALIIKATSKESVQKRLLDFAADIDRATEVYFTNKRDSKKEFCTFKKNRWQCSTRSWNYVGEQRSLMGGRWQRAVWAHPLSNKTLHIVFNKPPDANMLVLGTAFLARAYQAKGDNIGVAVFADGKEILEYKNKNINRYYRNSVALPDDAKEIDVTFFVHNDGGRHFVFNGFLGKQ